MKLTLILNLLICTLKVHAEAPYNILDANYEDSGTVYEVTPLTPIKAQDDIGICYGFSTTSLLENYRCRELSLDCSDPHEFLSSLDVTSYLEKKSLKEGGHSDRILSNLQDSPRKVAREECIKFSTLVHTLADSNNNMKTEEKRAWVFLTRKWNEYKGIGTDAKRNDCVSCLADSIKSTLVNIQTPADQIKNAFLDARSLEEFLYKALLPAQCLEENKMAQIPPFKTKVYPGNRDTFSEEGMSRKIESLLLSNIPLEMGICVDSARPCRKDLGHSIALVGIKEVCNHRTGDCRSVVKVKNSYGMRWQMQHNDGWVDLKTLIEAAGAQSEHASITWIEKPGFTLQEKRLNNRNVPSYSQTQKKFETKPVSQPGVPAKYKDFHGTWKCPGAKFTDRYEPGCVPMR